MKDRPSNYQPPIMQSNVPMRARNWNSWQTVHLPIWIPALLVGIIFLLINATPAFAQEHNPVTSGGDHSCAITNGGAVKCWGLNDYGQLGNGSTAISHFTPVDVTGLSSGVVAIDAGRQHTCAVMNTGGAKCWGSGGSFRLGDGSGTPIVRTPVDVTALNDSLIDIAAGESHTCALTSSGGVKCWGINSDRQLGNVSYAAGSSPDAVDVTGLSSGVIDIVSGSYSYHTCALMATGGVKCWGHNSYGQLGDGTNSTPTSPVDVTGLSGRVVSLAVGERHTCAVMDTGSLKCWGENQRGQLGDGTFTGSFTPRDVSGLTSGVVSVAAGPFHTCAVLISGKVQCWGDGNFGKLGHGTDTTVLVPTNVVLLGDVVLLSLGLNNTCALKSNGELVCWGAGGSGQLGIGATIPNFSNGLGFRPWYVPPIDFAVALGGSALPPANIAIKKSDPTPYPPVAGQPVQYTIWVTNTGSVALTDLTVTDLPSADLTMTAFSSTPSGSCNIGTQRCILAAPLAPGAVATFNTTFDTGVTAGAIISNTAYATAMEAPTAHYPEGPIVTTKSVDGGSSVDLAITKSASVSQATTGTPFNYTLTVTNNGPEDATNVIATDVLPAGFTFNSATATGGGSCSQSAGTVTCTWASLANGANVTATINVTP